MKEENDRSSFSNDQFISFPLLSSLSPMTKGRKREIVQLVELKIRTNIRIGRSNDERSLVGKKRHQLRWKIFSMQQNDENS